MTELMMAILKAAKEFGWRRARLEWQDTTVYVSNLEIPPLGEWNDMPTGCIEYITIGNHVEYKH